LLLAGRPVQVGGGDNGAINNSSVAKQLLIASAACLFAALRLLVGELWQRSGRERQLIMSCHVPLLARDEANGRLGLRGFISPFPPHLLCLIRVYSVRY
jgi:hypothetical protein